MLSCCQRELHKIFAGNFIVKVMMVVFIISFGFNHIYCQDTLIKSGNVWQYYDKGVIDIGNFTAMDISWSEGPTPIGFGQHDEATVIKNSIGKDSVLTYFIFRKKITINNIEEYKTFFLRIVRDDGAIVYVNGSEVVRSNLPEGKITTKTRASTLVNGLAEYTFYEYFVSPSYFKNGENELIVILFQFLPVSSDCRFDLELLGYKDYEVLNSLIHNINSDRKLLEYKLNLFAVEKALNDKNDEIEFLKFKYFTNKNIFLIVIGLLVVSVILLIVFLIITWKKNHDIILKYRLLEKETDEKSKELINISLSLLKIKQFISSLLDDLKRVQKNAAPEQQVQIEKLINRIEFYKHSEEDWERLKLHFDTIHSGFFARLKNKFPELTQSELRHCAYIKLQMFTSEIAQMLNIDNKSVQASRYRIKKKMQLPPEVDLKKFLEDF
jgi:hypothetical protein